MKIFLFRNFVLSFSLIGFLIPSFVVFADSCAAPSLGQMTDLQNARIENTTTLIVSGVYWDYDADADTWSAILLNKTPYPSLPNNDPADVERKVIPGALGLTTEQKSGINLHLARVCQTLKNKMESYDREAGSLQTDRTYEVRSFTTCQAEYLAPELKEIQDVLNTPVDPDAGNSGNTNENGCELNYNAGISKALACIKQSQEYKDCQKAIEDVKDEIDELTAGNQDEETQQEIQTKVQEKQNKEADLIAMTTNQDTQVGLLQGYIGSLQYYVSNARTKYIGVATGSFDVGRLSIGNEKNFSITTDVESENNLLTKIIRFALTIIGTLSIVVLVIGGFFMIISNGDENALQKGKTIVTYALGGVALAFLSYIIVQFVLGLLFATAG